MSVQVQEIRDTITTKFARWAAASAARQGPRHLRGRKWYQHLDQVDLAGLLTMSPPISSAAFLAWHQREVEGLADRAGVQIGWAAKMVNMLLKIHVYIAGRGDSSLLAVIHPPIDNDLIDAIQREFPVNDSHQPQNLEIWRKCKLGKPISGVTTYPKYSEVIAGLTLVSGRRGCTLFEIESLWGDAGSTPQLKVQNPPGKISQAGA